MKMKMKEPEKTDLRFLLNRQEIKRLSKQADHVYRHHKYTHTSSIKRIKIKVLKLETISVILLMRKEF